MKMLRRCMAVCLGVWMCTVSVSAQGSKAADTQDAARMAQETALHLDGGADLYEALSGGANMRMRTVDTYEETDYEGGIAAALDTANAVALDTEDAVALDTADAVALDTADTEAVLDTTANETMEDARTVAAQGASVPLRLPIVIDGVRAPISAYLFADGVSYLSLREIASLLFPDAEIGWDAARGVATLNDDGISITAKWGEPYIEANGRYFALSGFYPPENLLVSGVTYIPLRNLARAAGASITWNRENGCAELITGKVRLLSGDDFYDADDVYWLSKIIYAESGDQSLRGQLAVGAVVRNRQAHPSYPNTVYGVIFDRKYGVQFSPVADGAINKMPSQTSIIAAKLVLDGCMITREAIYFLDPRIASSFWIVENREFLFTIGCHDFYV